jgi:hypothetical protein
MQGPMDLGYLITGTGGCEKPQHIRETQGHCQGRSGCRQTGGDGLGAVARGMGVSSHSFSVSPSQTLVLRSIFLNQFHRSVNKASKVGGGGDGLSRDALRLWN